MRLTLRTLLAYIDHILDPKDQEELAQKVGASDVAHDLLHRTQDVTRRLRLPAPPLNAEGPYSDPNAMAEYLDNVLPPDDVPHFERRCLELEEFPDADSYLAEATNCHHVLTMVLGQRADIDPELKQKLYSLGGRTDPSNSTAPEDHTPPPQLEPHSPEVPDYLRASERPMLLRMSPAIAALALFGATMWFAFGPGGWLRSEPQVGQNEQVAPTPESPDTPEEPAAGIDPAADVAPAPDNGAGLPVELLGPGPMPGEAGSGEAGPGEAGPVEQAVPEPDPAAPTGLPPELSLPAESPTTPDTPDAMEGPTRDDSEGGAAGERDLASVPPAPIGEGEPADTDEPGTQPDQLPSDSGEPGDSEMADDQEGMDSEPGSVGDPSDPDAMGEPAVEEPEPPKRLGISEGIAQVLLRKQPDGSWRRLNRRAEVMPGDTLLSLPTYRPSLGLDSGIVLDLVDGALVETSLLGESTPAISVTYGRVLLTNTSSEGREVSFAVGSLAGRLTLEPRALLAVDIRRPFQPGMDPRSTSSPLTAECYAPRGGVVWVGDDFSIDAQPQQCWLVASNVVEPPEMCPVNPAWIVERELSAVEKQASPAVAKHLTGEEPVWSQLTALGNSKRKEERALASIIAVHVGKFDSLIQALRDDEQNLSWEQEVQALRFAMSSSTDLAQAVYQELANQHRQEVADDLFEMLCGYSVEQVGRTPEEWRVGALRKLIDWLASDKLDYRVLANYNLEQITGRRGVFNPAGLSSPRNRDVKKLRARLEKGELPPRGMMPEEN